MNLKRILTVGITTVGLAGLLSECTKKEFKDACFGLNGFVEIDDNYAGCYHYDNTVKTGGEAIRRYSCVGYREMVSPNFDTLRPKDYQEKISCGGLDLFFQLARGWKTYHVRLYADGSRS